MTADDRKPEQQAELPAFHVNLLRAIRRDYWRDRHHSTSTFLRGAAFGYAIETLPALGRILFAAVIAARKRRLTSVARFVLQRAYRVLVDAAFQRRSLALFFGVGLGGASWLDGVILRALCRLWLRKKSRRLTAANNADDIAIELMDSSHRHRIRLLSTFLSTSLSAACAFSLQARPSSPKTPLSQLPLVSLGSDSLPDNALALPVPAHGKRYDSSTLDFTLFLLVRAADTAIRAVYANSKPNKLVNVLARIGDTSLFILASWRIMWVWFYKPWLLPPSYDRWIHSLAKIDGRLLELLRLAKDREWVYGQIPNTAAAQNIGPSLCTTMGCRGDAGMPDKISAFPCEVVHGPLVASRHCEVNIVTRWAIAFGQGLALYIPVHFLPLILARSRLSASPRTALYRAAFGSARSSAFLASFVGLVWFGVCFGRTRVGPKLIKNQQIWDGGLAMLLGTFLSGFSVLIENKRRRGEMALFVAPRALYAILEDILPMNILTNDNIAVTVERLAFSLSAGVVVTASVHEEKHIRGIVRAMTRLLTADWASHAARC